jgi:hypothetical protein|tara:strand:+ start:53 stop:331 length:279 start_codon:yes stop_codon:yes gene_type:complete
MMEDDIEYLIKAGYWMSVSPVMSKEKWSWTCGVYKRGKKTGNWITEDCKTHKTPSIAYKWGAERIKDIIELAEHKEHKIEHKVCSENKKNKI